MYIVIFSLELDSEDDSVSLYLEETDECHPCAFTLYAESEEADPLLVSIMSGKLEALLLSEEEELS